METRAQTIEKRKEPRFAVQDVFAKLHTGGATKELTCFVWDISRHGVRLKLPAPVELPRFVHVAVANKTRLARVAWTKGDQVGLEFFEPCDIPTVER